MTLQEAYNSGKWFSRPIWTMKLKKVDADEVLMHNRYGSRIYHQLIEVIDNEALLANDYFIVDKDTKIKWTIWYKDIPRDGVLCCVWNDEDDRSIIEIVIKYESDNANEYPFLTAGGLSYQFARPVTSGEIDKYILKEKKQ